MKGALPPFMYKVVLANWRQLSRRRSRKFTSTLSTGSLWFPAQIPPRLLRGFLQTGELVEIQITSHRRIITPLSKCFCIPNAYLECCQAAFVDMPGPKNPTHQ